MSDSDWRDLKKQALDRKREIVYNTDGCDALYFPKTLAATKENFINQRLVHALGTKIDTISYCPLSSGFGYLTSKTVVGDQLLVNPKSKSRRNVTGEFLKQGTDPLRIAQEFCRANDFEFFISLRCNDTHDIHHSKEKPFLLFPPFKEKNPQYLMGSYENRPRYSSWSAVDFTHKEIRERFVAIIKELLTNYEADGIELDFCRHLQYFKSVAYGGNASASECEMMSDCIRQIRELAESIGRKRGRPILVSVRLPDSIEFSKACGLDIETWMREKLIDIYIGGFYTRLNPWRSSVEIAKKYRVKFYSSMDESRIRKIDAGFNRNTIVTSRARQCAALAAGVDGLYFFNREGHNWLHNGLRGNLDDIRFDDKRYFISYRYSHPQNYLSNGEQLNNLRPLCYYSPIYISKDKPAEFLLEIGDDFEDSRVKENKPTLTAYASMQELGAKMVIKVNGNKLPIIEPDDENNSSIVLFKSPLEFFKKGINKVEVSAEPINSQEKIAKPNQEHEITILAQGDQLKEKVNIPWWRLYRSPGNSSGEEIVDGAYRISNTGKKKIQYTNLIYTINQLVGKDVRVGLEVKVESSSDQLCNVIRIANGENLEVVTLEPNKISLLYTDISVPFNTTDKFHDYQISMKDGRIVVFVDEKEILNSELKAKVGDRETLLRNNLFSVAGMNEKSLLIGSLSRDGVGAALWKNIRFITDDSGVVLNDLRFDLVFEKLL